MIDVDLKNTLIRKYGNYSKRIMEYEKIEKPNDSLNYFGGMRHGYLRGRMSLIEDILDMYDTELTDSLIKEFNTMKGLK